MTKIFFSNKQFAKLKELVYLGERVKNSFYVHDQDEYDTDASDLHDYIDSFAKDHDMKQFLNEKNEFTFDFDEIMHPIIDAYDNNALFTELAERLAKRDFFDDHQRNPIFDFENEERDEYNKMMNYEEKYETEFENHGVERLFIRPSQNTDPLP